MTYAQTWDVGYGTGEQTFAAPVRLAAAATSGPRLAPHCLGSRRQAVPEQAVLDQAAPDTVPGTATIVCQILLSVAPEAARAARQFTTTTLREWQLDELIEEAVLIASELVTNAIRHGRCCAVGGSGDGVELTWQRQAARVICMVTDRSPRPPLLGTADYDAESGRGLQVVQALAATWGWMMLSATSKAVWAALTISR